MYFPYLRGRQYELLALKELANKKLMQSSIIPVIEPVKLIPALDNALAAFDKSELSIALILNPNVGDLQGEPEIIDKLVNRFSSNTFVILSVLLNESTDAVMQKLLQKELPKNKILVVFENRDYLDTYHRLFSDDSPKYTLCPDERAMRRAVHQNKVLFENKFNKQSRNADYPDDEFFSDDHLYYKEDGYLGFGDYSIIGNDYIESGFAPYAVAIHIVYFDDADSLRIKHFISDSNEGISDVAGKFNEAVTKLYNWYACGNERQLTRGLQTLLDHYKNGTYPGLPTLKKLSVMHHLELMSNYLDGRKLG